MVRRIRGDEWERLRALRLQALADAPMAFGSTLAAEAAFADAVWQERASAGAAAADRVTFVAEANGRWVGMATGLAIDPGEPDPALVGMFVDPAARGRGAGAALVEAVSAWARARGAARLTLWVTDVNAAALALYRRSGFRPTGETQPLDHTPSIGEIRMARDLR